MPMKLQLLNKMTEEEAYICLRRHRAEEHIIQFLRMNRYKAFTNAEITYALNSEVPPMEGIKYPKCFEVLKCGKKFERGTVANIMKRIIERCSKMEQPCSVGKKGSFHFYVKPSMR